MRTVPGNGLCGLQRYIYTWAIVAGIDAFGGYQRRYCFEHRDDAEESFSKWDGLDHPEGPWIKLKGLNVELLNPNLGDDHEKHPAPRN